MSRSTSRPASAPSTEEKLSALQEVLQSRTFQKSELLIRFLKYIGEMELAGQGAKISEYGIATQALGRPADFSPEADSSVRSRAHALRRKLEDCYREELTTASLRIVLPKGSYVPEFHETRESEQPASTEHAVTGPEVKKWPTPLFIGVALGLLLGIVGAFAVQAWRAAAGGGAAPQILAKAWGPLLQDQGEVMLVVAVPKQFWAREFPNGVQPRNEKWYPQLPQDEQLKRWFFDSPSLPAQPGSHVLLHPNVGSPLWGDVVAASGAAELLAKQGVKHQILPERVLRPYALRGRNALLFGLPEYSPAVRRMLQGMPYTIQFDPESRWEAVMNRAPRPGEPPVFRRQKPDTCLGLITVITTEESARQTRAVSFSGLTSAGAQAAQEFYSSPEALSSLWARFRAEGLGEWPKSFQVVIEASIDTNLPIKSEYKAHRLISP